MILGLDLVHGRVFVSGPEGTEALFFRSDAQTIRMHLKHTMTIVNNVMEELLRLVPQEPEDSPVELLSFLEGGC